MTPQKYPEPTVGALILNPEGELLLMKSHKWHDRYVVPGGHIEMGEKIEDALRREVKEETNLDIYDIEFLCYQDFIYDPAFWKRRHFIFLDFTCKTDSEDVILNEEASEFIWVNLEEALNLPVDTYTAYAIRLCMRKNRD